MAIRNHKLIFSAICVASALTVAGAASAATEILTLTNDSMTDPLLGTATMTGTETFTAKGMTFDFTIQEDAQGQMETYSFTSLSQSGEASHLPPTPCIEYGCTGPVPPGPVYFSLPFASHLPIPFGDGLAITGFSDSVYVYGGFGTLTETFVNDVPEPATWTLMLAGFGLVGAVSTWRQRRGGRRLREV